ncbi:hypothetical protein CJF30_00011105 [Rutstroemia sp. NJR-2017a BBW]|nr:hypothetical protein CJF30_00011105 [Rutstroemia sp. NJR-2017a BBW]
MPPNDRRGIQSNTNLIARGRDIYPTDRSLPRRQGSSVPKENPRYPDSDYHTGSLRDNQRKAQTPYKTRRTYQRTEKSRMGRLEN